MKRFSLFSLFTIFSIFAILVFAFRSLALHMSTNLPDWNDYPFYVWTIYQNIGHFQQHTLSGFFNTNIFAGYQGSLLFSDLLLPQSLIALPLALVIPNHVLVFNILFFITLFLDVCAVYFFWKQITDEKSALYFAVFATCISGLLFQNSVHFQFVGFWPFFMGLGFLVRPQKKFSDVAWLGFWTGFQFLAGVYLSIFLMCATAAWYGMQALWNIKNRKILLSYVRELCVIGLFFLLVAGFFGYKYMVIKKAYHITREYWEYIYYSAHLTDYIFSTNYSSVVSNLWPVSKWNTYNHAGSLFPGFLLTLLAALGLWTYRSVKEKYSVTLSISRDNVFYFLLLIGGFFASLGPRLNVNGTYATIPLPYFIPLKLLPLLEPIRVNGRWYLFVVIALIYFALKGMKKFPIFAKKEVLALVCAIIVLEVMPINRQTEAKAFYHDVYPLISAQCQQKPQVLLEYPMTQDAKDVNVVSNLTYRTQAMLASTYHHCILVNGYMGYAPKDYERYEQVITDSVNRNVSDVFWRLIAEKDVRYIKLNKKDLFAEKVATLSAMLRANPKVKMLANTDVVELVEITP